MDLVNTTIPIHTGLVRWSPDLLCSAIWAILRRVTAIGKMRGDRSATAGGRVTPCCRRTGHWQGPKSPEDGAETEGG